MVGPAWVTMHSGVVVKAPDEVLRVVSEGGGMRQLGQHVTKITMRTDSRLQKPVDSCEHTFIMCTGAIDRAQAVLLPSHLEPARRRRVQASRHPDA
jgi:hypothetical protein